MTISTLINKQDTYEIVRDKIAMILAEESVAQQALAVGEGLDPELWKLRVFTERTAPWAFLRTDDGKPPADLSPIVCVWYDNSNVEPRASQTIDRQQYDAIINIDVYGIGVTEVQASSQTSGDEAAARTAQRGARLSRNILMSDTYVTLGFARSLGLVGARSITTIQAFQPEYGQNAQHVNAVRLTLAVRVSEYGPQTPAEILEEICIIVRNEYGQIVCGDPLSECGAEASDASGQILVGAKFESTP